MRRCTNRPVPAPPLVEKLLEFTGISRLFPIKGRLAMTWYPNSYRQENSLKAGKIELKRTRPTFGSPPLGRSRAPANGRSPRQAKLPPVGLPTPRRDALGTAPGCRWAALLRLRLCPQNTATSVACARRGFVMRRTWAFLDISGGVVETPRWKL